MKRLLISAALFLCCMATTFAQFSGSGSGTENDPYLILNPIQLNQLRNFLNMEGVYFKLMADIDLTEYLEDENPDQGWQPVGTSSTPFKGVLDGNGKTISGLWINRSNTDYVGLFGYCKNATIKNLKISNADIRGKMYVGVVSGYQYGGSNSNCVLSGKVKGTGSVGGCTGVIGGINVSGISSSVDVIGGDFTGGIAGWVKYNSCSVSNCYVNSSISGNNKIGGIIGGEDYKCEMSNSGFVGSVTGTSYVGGISGYSGGYVKNCYAVAFVSGRGDYTGGLIGYDNSIVEDCYFSGSVTGQKYTGGLIGYSYSSSVKKCYSHGSVTGTSYVGGLCGYIYGHCIESNVIIASSIKATEGYVGRLYGYNGYNGNINIGSLGTSAENKSYNRTIVISQGVAQDISDDIQNGTGVSATTLKLKATYVAMGWDFNSTWAIQETECFPYMQRQTAPPVITSNVVSNATSISGKCIDGGTINLEVDGTSQQMIGTGHTFSFNVSPLQAGHEVLISAKADGKEPSYYTTETVSYLGKGTESDPYQIYTAADLTGVYRKGYFKLMNDINLTDYINQFSPTEGWESIGREGSETIHFDGNGKKITGLWCNSTRDNTGLFSCFANGEIKNLTLETESGKQVKGGANTGILIGKMINGSIVNCKVSGKVADGTPVGGLVGLFTGGSISRCQAAITITTTGKTSYVGGIVGEISGGTIDQCVTTGTLTGIGDESYVGGMVGKNYATITNCYSTANITSSYNAAGIIAYNYGVVDKCLYTGNLYSSNYAAGIIGYNDGENAVVQNSVATSNKIEVVYESQQVQQGGGYGQRIIGGIKNNAPAPEMNNYALKTMQVSVNDVPQKVYDDIMNGVAKTSTELKKKATFQTIGWNFNGVWSIDEDSSYPYQIVKVEGGSDPINPDDPTTPEDPNPDDPNDQQGGVEVTDISQMDNAIGAESITGFVGSEITLPIVMKNTENIIGMQFDLTLPKGVSIVTDEDDEYVFTLTNRATSSHSVIASKISDGNYRVLVSSLQNSKFKGIEGAIMEATLAIANDMAAGEYPVKIANIEMSTAQNIAIRPGAFVSKLTIQDSIPGDANGDGTVSVTDVTMTISYILGQAPDGFNVEAADVNGDGSISVTDVTTIISIILGNK